MKLVTTFNLSRLLPQWRPNIKFEDEVRSTTETDAGKTHPVAIRWPTWMHAEMIELFGPGNISHYVKLVLLSKLKNKDDLTPLRKRKGFDDE